MIHIYLQKQYVKDRHVLYDPGNYFDRTVVTSIENGDYKLKDRDKALIAKEGCVQKLYGSIIETAFGKMTLRDLSMQNKILILLQYLKERHSDYVVNLVNSGKYFASILKEADRLGIDVFWNDKYFDETWFNADMYVLINDNNVPVNLAETSISRVWSYGWTGYQYTSDTRLQFKGNNTEYDLFFSSTHVNLKVGSQFEKVKLLRDMKNAVIDGTMRITGTRRTDFADDVNSPIQVLFLNTSNVSEVSQKLEDAEAPYVLICDDDNDFSSLSVCDDAGFPLNEIRIFVDENMQGNYEYKLIRKEIPATESETSKIYYSIEDNSFQTTKRKKIDFADLEI